MKRPPDRRTVLAAAGAAAVAAAAGPGAAQASDVRGAVAFEGGATIPEGRLRLYLEDPAVADAAQGRVSEALVESDGKSTEIAFSLALDALAASPTRRVVVRLERPDGWLIARGSAKADPASAVEVVLKPVIY